LEGDVVEKRLVDRDGGGDGARWQC
jgi:hypothetical protein